jgi:simple sugar transport system substrate-binding protein
MAGEWLAKKLGGKGNIIQLEGSKGADPAIDREKGFREAIAKHPGMKIVKTQTGDFTRDGGKTVTKALLAAAKGEGQKIDAIYAHNDEMAHGAILSIEEAGLKPGKDIVKARSRRSWTARSTAPSSARPCWGPPPLTRSRRP